MKNLVIILGAGGIIGSAISQKAFDEKNCYVVGLDSNSLENQSDFNFFKQGHVQDVVAEHFIQEIHSSIDLSKISNISIFANAGGRIISVDNYLKTLEKVDFEDDFSPVLLGNVASLFVSIKLVDEIKRKYTENIDISVTYTSSIYGTLAPDFSVYEGSIYNGKLITSAISYTAGKAAGDAMVKYLAGYYGDKQVRFNSVALGGVYSGQNEEFYSRYSARVPLNRMATAQECGEFIFSVGFKSPQYLNGQIILFDGGLSVR